MRGGRLGLTVILRDSVRISAGSTHTMLDSALSHCEPQNDQTYDQHKKSDPTRSRCNALHTWPSWRWCRLKFLFADIFE